MRFPASGFGAVFTMASTAATISSGSAMRPGPYSPQAISPSSGPTVSTPSAASVARLRRVAGCDHIRGFIAGAMSTGAFVASDLLLPVGAAVELTFTIPGLGDPVRAEGRIVRVQYRGTQPGMGVLFERMTPDDRARLRTFTAWN